MATLGLDEDELKSVEQMVAKLAQLSSSIQSLKMDVLKSNPLPPPTSLQASAQILQRNLQNVLDSLSEKADLWARMALHPSPNYPGRTQENILTQLLRKKLEPDVEELVAQGRARAAAVGPEGLAAVQDVWHELRVWTHDRVAAYVRDEAGHVYTADERAAGVGSVRTGLRRALDDESDDDSDDNVDDDDDDDDDEDGDDGDGASDHGLDAVDGKRTRRRPRVVRGPEPETLMWFANRGDFDVPRNVDYVRKAGTFKGFEGVNILLAKAREGGRTEPA